MIQHKHSRFIKLALSVFLLAVTNYVSPTLTKKAIAQSEEPEQLGSYARTIATESKEAQALFNQGMCYLYSFNHDEARARFVQAAALSPQTPAIHWAVAMTSGPHINFPFVDAAKNAAAWQAVERGLACNEKAPPVEKDLLLALQKRHSAIHMEERRSLDVAYAEAMRELWKKYPTDADVGALFAEALMDLWPWSLWDANGNMAEDTAEVIATLDKVLAISPNHPMALHLYIHALEASPNPERAALAAESLRNLQPSLGHMVHMPSHIDVRLGHWQRAIEANEKAISADKAYREKVPQQDFFRIYMAHNHHMLAYAAMMQGQSKRATDAIALMLAEIPEQWLEKNAMYVDGLYSIPYEMHLRFGRWNEMLNEPEPSEKLPLSRTFRYFARGVSYAALGKTKEARNEQVKFKDNVAQLPAEAMFVMNPAANVFAVANKMLEGEILYREGNVQESLQALREAVALEDQLRYIEPPDWIQPVRHALGATLMDTGDFVAAEEVYRLDLQRHPHNGWSLHGLSQSLQRQGKVEEAKLIKAQFEEAWKYSDLELSTSCFCIPGKDH